MPPIARARDPAAALRGHLASRGQLIRLIINNAGVGGSPTLSFSPQGFESIFATNHLGHFLLTILLLPASTATGSASLRIINVSSEVRGLSAPGSIATP